MARLSRTDDGYVLATGDRLLAEAYRTGDSWTITTGFSALTLLVFRDDRDIEAVVLDAECNEVLILRQTTKSSTGLISVYGSDDKLRGSIRADGVGGLNGTSLDGTVLFYAGRSQMVSDALDILITDAGVGRPLIHFFALVVAMEAESLGPLHSRARRA